MTQARIALSHERDYRFVRLARRSAGFGRIVSVHARAPPVPSVDRFAGSSGCAVAGGQRNTAIQTPPTPIRVKGAVQGPCRSRDKNRTGMPRRHVPTRLPPPCMTQKIPPASRRQAAARFPCFRRESSRKNGKANWSRPSEDGHVVSSRQPSRCKYQTISFGRLPDQMMMSCDTVEVGPHHHEGEQQVAQRMIVFGPHNGASTVPAHGRTRRAASCKTPSTERIPPMMNSTGKNRGIPHRAPAPSPNPPPPPKRSSVKNEQPRAAERAHPPGRPHAAVVRILRRWTSASSSHAAKTQSPVARRPSARRRLAR